MKLHLPTRLRAAVLACFAVVTSFTTTLATGALAGSAFVVTATALVAPQAEGAAFDSITYGGDFWISDYRYSFILDDVGSNGTVVAAYWGNSATGNHGANGLKVTDNGDGTYSVALDNCKLNNTAIDATTTLTSNRGTTFDGLVLKTGVVYTVTANGIVGGDNGAKATITDVASGTASESGTYNSNMNGNQNPPYNKVNDAYAVNGSTALVWTGDMAAWKNTSGEVTALSADKVLYFDASESVSKTADVGGDVSVAGMKLYDNYTINATAAANIAAANGVTVVGGKTMTLSAADSNTSTNTVSADFSGGLAVSSGTWALSGAVNARSLAVNGGVLTLSGAVNLSGMNFAAADGDTVGVSAGAALTFADSAAINLGNLAADTAYKIFDLASGASLNGWDALTAENFIVNGAALNSTVYELTLTNGTFMYSMLVSDLTWNGGDSGVWDFTTACWTTGDSGSVFGNDVNVIFNNTASVEVQGAINAGKITVTSGNTLTLSASEGNSISVTDLDIQGSLQNSVAIAVSGNVTMADTASWTLTDGAAQVLTEAQFANVKNMEIQNGASLALSSITTGQNETVDATQLSGAGNVILKLRGDNGVNFNLANFAGDIRVEKADGQASARLQLNNSVFHADSTIILQTNGDLVFNGTGTEINNDIVAEGTTKFFVNSGKSATINSDLSGAGTITKTAPGTLTLNGTVTVSEFISEGGTTNISGGSITAFKTQDGTTNVLTGSFGDIRTSGGTTNVHGGTVANWLDVRGGTVNLSGGTSAHLGVGQGGTLNVTGAHTTGQLRMSEQGVGNVNIRNGADLVITGSENGVNTSRTILISHWGHSSTLLQEGGIMTAEDAVVFTSWTGTGTYKVTGGTATVKGISFFAQSNQIRGSFLLGEADTGYGRVNIGSEGISKVSGDAVDVKLGNGTLGATADWTMGFDSGATSANVQLIGTDGGTVFDTMGHTVTVNTTLGGDGKLVKEGEGTLDLIGTVTSTGSVIAKGGMLNIKSAGPNSFSTMEVAEGGALTIETDAVANVENLKLVAPLTNKGTLTISGSLTVDLSGFTPETGSGAISYVDSAGNTSDNGYRTGNFTYKLIDNTGTLNDDAITSVVGSDGTYADGILTTTTPDYSNYWVNTTVNAVALGEGKKYRLNGGLLTVSVDANNILRTAEGADGTIDLTTDASLGNNESTVVTGKLKITGATLSLGSNKADIIDISSFSSLELDNGTIDYHGANTTFNNVTVAETGGTIAIEDMKGDGGNCDTMTLAGTTTLSENGTLAIKSTEWKYKVNIEALTGNGNISMASSSERDNAAVLTINSFSAEVDSVPTSFGGAITVTKNTGSATLNATIDNAVSSKGLNLVNGAVANMAIQTGGSWSGAVNVTGAGNSLTSTTGGMNLSQLNVTEGAALDLNGSVSALLMNQAGTVDIADMVLTDGAVLTYGNAANLLSVTDGMLAGSVVIASGLTLTDSGVNLGLSSAIAKENIDISAYTGANLTVKGESWYLQMVGVRYYWEGDRDNSIGTRDFWGDPKWSQTDDSTDNLVNLPGTLDDVVVVFSNGGEADRNNTMILNGAKTVAGVEISNGYYLFRSVDSGNGNLVSRGDLLLGTNAHLTQELRMSANNLMMDSNSSLVIGNEFVLSEGGDVVVVGDSAAITLKTGRNLTADTLDISTAGASLALSGGGDANSTNAVSLNSIKLGSGATLSLLNGSSNLTAAASSLSLGADAAILIEEGQVLDLTAINFGLKGEEFGQLLNAASGAGTLKVKADASDEANPTIMMVGDINVSTNVEMGQLKLNSNAGSGNYTLTIGANGSLKVGGEPNAGEIPAIGDDAGHPGVLNIESTATVKVDGGHLSAEHIKLGHSVSGYTGTLELSSTEGGSIITGSITLRNDSGNFTMSGGKLTITSSAGIGAGVDTTITGGILEASDASGWGVTGASVGGAAVYADSVGNVTMTDTTITGDIFGNGKLVLAGTVTTTAPATVSTATVGGITLTTADANALTLSGVTLTNSIDNAGGKLVLTGTINVVSSDFTVGENGPGTGGGNGYMSAVQVYQLVTHNANLDATGATWLLDGASSGFSYADGSLTVTGELDATTYWVNTGTVVYADTDTSFDTATTIKLNGNSADGVDTLQLNTSPAEGLSIVATEGASTVINLNGKDVALDAAQLGNGVSAATVTLIGSGKYSQSASGNALSLKVGGVTDSANWTGTVSVSGRINGLDADALGNANSWVELKGVSGYPIKADTINTNILLTNNGDSPALSILNGWTGSVVTFAGQVSGSGDIARSAGSGGTQTYVFAGDVSEWDGSFKNTVTTNGTIVKFTGGSDINASFYRSGNYNLQVVVDTSAISEPETVVMSGSVTATSLTVAEGTTVKLTGSLALGGALTSNGTTQLAGDAVNGVTLGQVGGTGALEVLSGDLTMTAKSEIGTLRMAADATLKLDLTALGVTDLKNWSAGPMLTLDTLESLTTGGGLNISALVSEAALLTLTDGESKVLANITNCGVEELHLFVNGDTSSVLPQTDGFKYEYKLVQENGDTQVLVTATRVAEGWAAQDTDPDSLADTTWTDADSEGSSKWGGAGSIGKFYGHGVDTVYIERDGVTTASSVVVSASAGTTDYTFAGDGLLNAASLGVNNGSLTIDNVGVTTTGDAVLSDSGKLKVNADKSLTVGGDMGVLDTATLENSGTVTVDGTLSVAAGTEVSNAGTLVVGMLDASGADINSTGTLQTAGGTIGSLSGKGNLENSGELTIQNSTELLSLKNSGSLSVLGDLVVNSPVTQGGTVQSDSITVTGSAAFTAVTTDRLTAESLSLTTGSITTLDSNSLTVTGNVAVTENLNLKKLAGSGKLTVGNSLTLEGAVSSEVDVAAAQVVLTSGANRLGSVQTDMVSMAEGTTLSLTQALLEVEDIAALSGESVGISVSNSAFAALSKDEEGRYTAADYLIIDGASSDAAFTYANSGQLQAILSTGMSAGLEVTDGVLSLKIAAITDASGKEESMIWDTRHEAANNGFVISRGAGFYRSLDYVQKVQVREDTIFDLSAAAVGDSVAGNTSEPLAGVFVRNLSGGGKLTIKGNSAEQDVATLMNTPGRAIDAVALTADAATVNLGLPKGTIGYLESDAASVGPTLDALKLVNRSVVNVNSNTEVLGDTDVADYTRLSVKEGNMLTTGMLSGTDEAEISGVIRVTRGGVYTGTYDEASVIAAAGSKLRLRTGGRRGLSILAQNGGSMTLDSAGQDGRMDHFCVGANPYARMAENGGASLKLLNTSLSEGAIHHSTITLTEDEGNYINESEVSLSLGAAETARTLSTPGSPVVIDGVVDVLNSSITVNMLGNTVKDGVLEVNTASDKDLTLARLVTAGTVEGNTVTLAGTPEVMALLSKYYTNVRLESNGAILVDRVTDYYGSRLSVSNNARVGISMADAALVKLNPQANRAEYTELSGVLDALDAAVATGNSQAADELGAAVSGASVAALGAAVAGDVERQLMGIRNRTTTMGVDQTQVNENMPYFNAWINAEGDFRRMDEDGTAAGYELSSWGGTVGFDVDMTPRLTVGLAATAMYGDFTAKSADHAEGDLDTYYVTAFGRYATNRWSHTFVASVGMADTSLKRTVSHAGGSYSAEGDAEGMSFGFLYELGYVIAMNETATACLQPVFNVMLSHSSLDGYAEEGGDAALKMGGVDMTTVTFGMGARAQAIVGTNLYNRSSMVEGRALLKLRTGDTEAEAENSLSAVPGAMGSVQSAEIGTIGVELGVGITIPMGLEGGAVFADASLELGGGYTNINGTVGYRINF